MRNLLSAVFVVSMAGGVRVAIAGGARIASQAVQPDVISPITNYLLSVMFVGEEQFLAEDVVLGDLRTRFLVIDMVELHSITTLFLR